MHFRTDKNTGPGGMRFRQRLSVKLTVWVILTLLVLFALAAFVASKMLERNAVQGMQKTGFWFSDTVKRATRFSMLKDQRDSVHAIIEAIGKQEGVEVIRVFNKQGRIMFSSRKSEIGQMVDLQAEACFACHFKDRPLKRLPQTERSRIFQTEGAPGAPGHRVLGVITPIYTEKACFTDPCHAHPPEQKVLGVLDVGLDLSDVDSQVASNVNQVSGYTLTVLLIVTALMGVVSYIFLNRPLSGLVKATRRIISGDYDHPVRQAGNDEIGQLARYFEEMRQSVKDKTEALTESRRNFQVLFEQVPCHITVQDRDLRLVAVNKEFERQFGEHLGEYCYRAYKGRDDKCPNCLVEKSFLDGRVHTAEEEVCSLDGEPRHLLNVSTPITDMSGNITSVMEMATDVTELRRLEQELRKSEEKYRQFFNSDPNVILVIDQEELTILDANHRACRDLGYEHKNLVGLPVMEIIAPVDRARFKHSIKSESGFTPRLTVLGKEGASWTVNIRASFGEHVGRPAVIAALADITETLKTEQQLVQAAKMATLGEMSAGVAHELNQPLSIMNTGGNILLKQLSHNWLDTQVVRQVAEEIGAQVERATRIITHLREFGRKSEVRRSLVDVKEPINGVFQLMGQQLKVHDIKVDLDLPEDLPPIWGDANRLEQVFLNLVLNARDAIEERRLGQPSIMGRIKVSASSHNGQIEISVEDNGGGIPPDKMERIFEPFFTTKEVGKGTGLGLSISYGIVRDYQGGIEVSNTPWGGARFLITFQAARQDGVFGYGKNA